MPTTWNEDCLKCGVSMHPYPEFYDPIWHEVKGGVCLTPSGVSPSKEDQRVAFISTDNVPKVRVTTAIQALFESRCVGMIEPRFYRQQDLDAIDESSLWITSSCDFGSDELASRDFCTQQLIRLDWAPKSPKKPRDYYVVDKEETKRSLMANCGISADRIRFQSELSAQEANTKMKVVLDVQYGVESFSAAAVFFWDWSDSEAELTIEKTFEGPVAEYVPGQFRDRELPCLMKILAQQIGLVRSSVDTIVIDGYVDLGEGRPGLGRYLHDALKGIGVDVTVVGVAKNPFKGADAVEILHGDSKSPLYVTSTGDRHSDADAVKSMSGPYRIPTLLKLADSLARGTQ